MKISSKFKSIQSSIFCAVSILVLSAVLVVTVVSLRYTNSSIYENSVMYTQTIIKQLNQNIDSYISYMDNIASVIAQSGDAYKYLYSENGYGATKDENYSEYRQRLVEQFKTILKGRADIRNIGIVREDKNSPSLFDNGLSVRNTYVDLNTQPWSAEFLDRIKKGEKLPLLTSCCPAWVKFITDQYKEYIPNLSTCRSPQGMLSAVIKEYFRDPEHAGGKKTVMISIMPCTAKKAEAVRPNSFTDGEQDTDIVITTTELLRMIDNFGLDFATLDPEACDMPFGFGSGGGVIFGVTGGVTEAVLRRLTPDHSKETMHEIAECGVRGDEGIKEFTVPYEGMNLNICVASGLANARTVMEQVKNGEKEYHLIEIMACRRGCIMGGGQPTRSGDRTKALRAKGLYNADNTTIIKKSDENPLVLELYNGLLKGKEHHLLHNDSY